MQRNEYCRESEMQNSYQCIYRLLVLMTAWLPGSCGQRCPASREHMYHISLAQEKVKIQSMVSTECVWLLHHHKVKKS